MSVKEKGQALEKWAPIFISCCVLFGILLGSLVLNYVQGEIPYEVVAGGVVTVIVLSIIQWLKTKFKKNNLPDADERVVKNVFRYTAFCSHIFLAIVFCILAVFTVLGQETEAIFYLWVVFFLYIWTVGIGTLILKRR